MEELVGGQVAVKRYEFDLVDDKVLHDRDEFVVVDGSGLVVDCKENEVTFRLDDLFDRVGIEDKCITDVTARDFAPEDGDLVFVEGPCHRIAASRQQR